MINFELANIIVGISFYRLPWLFFIYLSFFQQSEQSLFLHFLLSTRSFHKQIVKILNYQIYFVNNLHNLGFTPNCTYKCTFTYKCTMHMYIYYKQQRTRKTNLKDLYQKSQMSLTQIYEKKLLQSFIKSLALFTHILLYLARFEEKKFFQGSLITALQY